MSEEAGMSSHLLIKPEDSDRVPAVWPRRKASRGVVFRCLGATALETVNGIRRVTRLSPFIFRLCILQWSPTRFGPPTCPVRTSV